VSPFESWADRGWRDTKLWLVDWRFLMANVLSSAAVVLAAHPALGIAWGVALLPIVAGAAFLHTPIVQRNEARQALRELLRDEASVRIEVYLAEWEGAYLRIWNDGPSDEFEIVVNPVGHDEMDWSPCHPRWGIEDVEMERLFPDENGLEGWYELEPQALRRTIHNGGYEYVSIALSGVGLHSRIYGRRRHDDDATSANWDEASRSIPADGRIGVRFFANEMERGFQNTTLADGEQLRFTVRVLRARSQPIDADVQLRAFIQTPLEGKRWPGISLKVIRQALVGHRVAGETSDDATTANQVPRPAD